MTDRSAFEHASGAGHTGPGGDGPAHDVDAMFQRAEHTGLRLAIIGRTLALAYLGPWLVWSRASDPVRAMDYALAVAAFAALGLLHYALIGSRFDRAWIKYAFAALDIAALSLLVATQPLYASANLPPMMLYRATVFEFYFLVLGLAAFSFSPGAVLWTGIAGALGWLGTFAWRSHGLDGVLNWSDIPPRPSAEQVTAVVLDPAFGALGSRMQEAISLVVVAFLLAVVMHRARRTLTRQLEVERDRSAIYCPHNCSIVLKLTGLGARGFSYLITGDTENPRWDRINKLFGTALMAHVLAAPHGACFALMLSVFSAVFDRIQNAAMHRLHEARRSGQINSFILPYLGQLDRELPNPPADLVRREEAHAYPTDFNPMPNEWIERLSLRGKQLTLCLARAYMPVLIDESYRPSDPISACASSRA